jgi:hypothetical protein
MENSKPLVLLDETHNPLLRSHQTDPPESILDTWNRLREEIEALGCSSQVIRGDFSLSPPDRPGDTILVLAAPADDLTAEEVQEIETFVWGGGSLLLAVNSQSLWQQKTDSLSRLARKLGTEFKPFHNKPLKFATAIYPHFITAGVRRLRLWDLAILERKGSDLTPVISIDNGADTVLGCLQRGRGRVVVASDIAWLGDRFWQTDESPMVVRNVLRWLAFQNPLDCFGLKYEPVVRLEEPNTVSIMLSNPQTDNQRRVRCLLTSPTPSTVTSVPQNIPAIPAGGQIWVSWIVTPQQLGQHSLNLTIEIGTGKAKETLTWLNAAPFMCQVDAELSLRLLNSEGNPVTSVLVDAPFVAEGKLQWLPDAPRATTKLELHFLRTAIHLAEITKTPGGQSWKLIGRKAGDYELRFGIKGTDQQVRQRIRLSLTPAHHIQNIRTVLLPEYEALVKSILGRIRTELVADPVTAIRFQVFTPEEYTEWVYPRVLSDRLRDVLEAARRERQPNDALRRQLAAHFMPLYSARLGACVPFDPDLARRWGDLHREFSEQLADNFLTGNTDDQVRLKQNLMAYLLHEKYGHGFFSVQTLVGRQLAILDKYRFLEETDAQFLPLPHPRYHYAEYAEVIDPLQHSTIMVDEGFAAWIELRMLRKVGGEIGQAYDRRKNILLDKADLFGLLKEEPYFKAFEPVYPSQYREGFEKLELISEWFGLDCGEKCAIQAVIRAAEVELGIEELERTVHFGLSPEQMRHVLLEDKEVNDGRTDMRLRYIFEVLWGNRSKIRDRQLRLECHRECLHPECPINACISEELGW